jgi:YHS domain-containing protein
MEVEESGAAGQSEYDGQAYFFCSQSCKEQFDRDPGQYAGGAGQTTEV